MGYHVKINIDVLWRHFAIMQSTTLAMLVDAKEKSVYKEPTSTSSWQSVTHVMLSSRDNGYEPMQLMLHGHLAIYILHLNNVKIENLKDQK